MKTFFSKRIRYYGSFQIINVIFFVMFSSFGAFFHFLLNHEIGIVESWLHHNHWQIIIVAKGCSFFLLNRWFRIRLYQMKSIKEMVRDLLTWPDHRTIVISTFMLVSFLTLSEMIYVKQNVSYWYNHITSILCLVLFYGIDFMVFTYLEDILDHDDSSYLKTIFSYGLIFSASFRLCIPDYYQQFPNVLFSFLCLIYLSGKSFRKWGNALCFILLFVAPMGALFGMDPIWGDDFSPFTLKTKLSLSFLVVIWMISFFYYSYRDRIILSSKKIFR